MKKNWFVYILTALGLALSVGSIYVLLQFRGVQDAEAGFSCRFSSCYPGDNAASLAAEYPGSLIMDDSAVISSQSTIFNLNEEAVCGTPVQGATTVTHKFAIAAAGIEVSPEGEQTDAKVIAAGDDRSSTTDTSWVIKGEAPGNHVIQIHTQILSDECKMSDLTVTLKVKILNTFGLSARTVKLITAVVGSIGFIGTVLGLIKTYIDLTKKNEPDDNKIEIDVDIYNH